MSARKRILLRGGKGLAAILIAGALGAVTSSDFRTFVGDDTLAALLVAALVPALLAAEKALQVRRR